jgi:signal transduction histidine kinase
VKIYGASVMGALPSGSRESRATVQVARLLAVLVVIACVTAIALPIATAAHYLHDLLSTPETLTAPASAIAGALLIALPRARRIGWLLLAIGCSGALYAITFSVASLALERNGPDWVVSWCAWVSNWVWLPAFLLMATVLPQVLPYGRPLSPRWGVVVRVAYGALVAAVVLLATYPGELDSIPVENPVGIGAFARVDKVLAPVTGVLIVGLALAGIASLVVRWLRADGVERRQIAWVGYGIVAVLVAVAFGPTWTIYVAALMVPAGIAIAAFRYRLYDIDIIVNRTLVAALLLGGAALAYVALVGWVGALLGSADGITPFVAAFLVALAFHPARLKAQQLVDRLLYGDRGNPYALLTRLDSALHDARTPREALLRSCEVLATGLRLPGAAVEVTLEPAGMVREEYGTVTPTAPALPLTLHGQELGRLLVAPRTGETSLQPADLRVLGDLTAPIASAAYAVRVTGDLEESRERLVSAREEERRRLRRDLHDGLGPQLTSVILLLETVRRKLARRDRDDSSDVAKAAELVDSAAAQTKDAVADVRRLVQGLRPPALDDLGLVGALRLTRAEGGPVVTVEASGDLEDLPAALEVAAYRIASEAVTNARKHAAATTVEITLRSQPDCLELDVVDDGAGLSPDRVAGVGLSSMRERATELGGRLHVGPASPHGTRVRAWLPR